jgi:hypothetical protein
MASTFREEACTAGQRATIERAEYFLFAKTAAQQDAMQSYRGPFGRLPALGVFDFKHDAVKGGVCPKLIAFYLGRAKNRAAVEFGEAAVE